MLRILVLVLVFFSFAFPARADDTLPAAVPSVKAKPRTEEEEKKLAETRKRVEEKKVELNGSSWELNIISSDPKAKGGKDTFTFQNGQFGSKNLSERGFVKTNYTITVPSEDPEAAVWETMQTGSEGVVFIRGEWTKDRMSGSITEQLDGGKEVKDYSFTTASRKSIAPTSSEEDQAPVKARVLGGGTAGVGTALVSKERTDSVAAFEPGTTDEVSG